MFSVQRIAARISNLKPPKTHFGGELIWIVVQSGTLKMLGFTRWLQSIR